MLKKIVGCLILAGALMFGLNPSISRVHAQQSGWVLNFQGRLFGQDKVPKSGSFDFTIRIYDASTAGTVLWGPKTYTATVTNGLYNLEIGPFAQNEIATVFTGNKRYLEVTVDSTPNGIEGPAQETLSPRIALTASSLALNSVLFNDKDATFYLDTSSTAQTKSGDLTVNGALSTGQNLNVTGNFVLGGVTITSAQLSTLIGGPTSNADSLHTHSHSSLQGLLNDDHPQYLRTDGTRLLIGDFQANNHKIVNLADPISSTDAANKKYVDNQVLNGSGWTKTGNTVVLTTTTDQVGIGTNTPDSKLHVVGTTHLQGDTTVNGTTTTDNLTVNQNATVTDTITVSNSANADANITMGSTNPALRWLGTGDVRIVETGGFLKVQEFSGGTWQDRWAINIATGDTTQTGGAVVNGALSVITTNGEYDFN